MMECGELALQRGSGGPLGVDAGCDFFLLVWVLDLAVDCLPLADAALAAVFDDTGPVLAAALLFEVLAVFDDTGPVLAAALLFDVLAAACALASGLGDGLGLTASPADPPRATT